MRKRLIISFLFVMLLLMFFGQQEAAVAQGYDTDTPYEYPIVPGTPDWNSMEDHVEKVEACQISEETLQRMTTEALLKSVLSYPLLGDMFAYSFPRQGYEALCSQFNGLQELKDREDLQTVLEQFDLEEFLKTPGNISEVICRSAFERIVKYNQKTSDANYDLHDPYRYPVLPGSDEWKALDSHADKVSACAIPDEILERMSTEALLDSVLNYPLLGDIYLWDTVPQGLEAVSSGFNGLQELMEREDISRVLQAFSPMEFLMTSGAEEYQLQIGLSVAERLISLCGGQTALQEDSPETAKQAVYTPAGSRVAVFSDTPQAGLSDSIELSFLKQYVAKAYPNASERKSGLSGGNCHAYAWYSDGADVSVRMESPEAYLTDGSFVCVETSLGGEKVVYGEESVTGITGYVYSAILSTDGKCHSKWGNLGVYRHDPEDCPYFGEETRISCWRLNLDYAD